MMHHARALIVAFLFSGLAACGGSGGTAVGGGPMAGNNTFDIAVAMKDASHPYDGVGSAFGLVVNGVQGLELILQRNMTYMFNVDTPTHPVYFTTDPVGGAGNPGRIALGVVNDLITSGVMVFTPDDTLPGQFFYQCGVHDNMGWRVTLTP